MDTKIYKLLNKELIKSGLSKRKFCEKFKIPHSWFIEFMNPEKPFRPMQVKTMSLLHYTFNFDIEVMEEYNKWVLEERAGR